MCGAKLKEGPRAQQGQPAELITLQDLAVSNAYEIAALVAVLESKGIATQREILEKVQRQRKAKGQ